VPLPEIHPLVRNPSEDSYREARARLLLRYLLGDDGAAKALSDLPTLYHFLSNYEYYSVLYGSARATRKLLSLLSSVRTSTKDRVEALLELYKLDNTYLEPLVDALLDLKVEVMKEGAPENLLKLFDETVASADTSKKNTFIRKAQVVLSYVRMFRESGPEQVARAVDVLLNRITPASSPPAPQIAPQLKPPTDADQVSLLRYIAESNVSGIAPNRDDILNYFGGDAVKATSLLQRLRAGTAPKVVHDKELGGFVVTPVGLKQLTDDGVLTPVAVRRLVAFIKKSPVVSRLVARGIFKPPEAVAGLSPGPDSDVEEDSDAGEGNDIEEDSGVDGEDGGADRHNGRQYGQP